MAPIRPRVLSILTVPEQLERNCSPMQRIMVIVMVMVVVLEVIIAENYTEGLFWVRFYRNWVYCLLFIVHCSGTEFIVYCLLFRYMQCQHSVMLLKNVQLLAIKSVGIKSVFWFIHNNRNVSTIFFTCYIVLIH